MTQFPMGPWRFALWAIVKICWLAAVVLFSLALPLLSLAWLLSWWERRENSRPPGAENGDGF